MGFCLFNTGLESETSPDDGHFARYSEFFLQQNVTGKLLVNLMSGDMTRFGVARVGDQLLLHDAIQELRKVHSIVVFKCLVVKSLILNFSYAFRN